MANFVKEGQHVPMQKQLTKWLEKINQSTDKTHHSLLQKQLKRLTEDGKKELNFDKFLDLITHSYEMADQECYIFDQSLSIMSDELTVMNEDLKRQAEELRKSEERYILASKGANDGLWDFDVESGICFYSERFREIIGWEQDNPLNSLDDWFDSIHMDYRQSVQSSMMGHLEGLSERFEAEYPMQHTQGEYIWVQTRGLAARDVHGKALRVAGSQTDISQRKKYEEQLYTAAFHDKLTGLPNRTLLLERLNQTLKRFKRGKNHTSGALMFLDLDRFKVVNDSLGHEAGDQLLVSVSRRLELIVRNTDTLCRIGGDEFTLLMPDIDSTEHAQNVSSRIIEELNKPFYIYDQEVFISGSVGLVIIDHYDEPENFIRNADLAMYQAKKNGKSRSEMFHQNHYEQMSKTMQIETDLRNAVDREEFIPYFQPLVNTQTGDIVSLEVLMRWNHPVKGIIPPLKFIPLAEETGMIRIISKALIRNVCKQLKMWRHAFGDNWSPRIAINLSVKQIFDPDHLEEIFDIFDAYTIPSSMIIFEVTESVIMENAQLVAPRLNDMKKRGFSLAIDDFGTGYSSLSYLANYPFDELKIDRSFISDVGQNSKKKALVKNIISLGQDLGLKTVAEGIETLEEFKILRALNCDYAQGYYFAKPMSALETLDYLASGVGMSDALGKQISSTHYLDRFSFMMDTL